ncbi:MAG: 16S rRNA (guanine(527)-N(7))-methyltransferase RsmG [Rhodospirillales bacterium]|nr:16S rRNA (guanine(527)-N(7))-methyltransferase RsmG [Rhodospirillales bacterium]
MTPDEFQTALNVSRETLDRVRVHIDILRQWQEKINLVGRGTLDHIWLRHVFDSAQLLPLLPAGATRLVDLGSGAGFPGLVLAILGVPEVHLIESDQRKAAFLREAARLTKTKITIHNARIEQVAPFAVDVVTSRALASLEKLIEYSEPFLKLGGVCLFPKGKNWQDELTAAEKKWKMHLETLPSRSDPDGIILRIDEVRRVHGNPDRSP